MKPRPSPRRGGKRVRFQNTPSVQPSLSGRHGKMWYSTEFVTWCKRHRFKPEGLARCILHTFALANPGGNVIVRSDHGPVSVDDIYDLPDDGKEPT